MGQNASAAPGPLPSSLLSIESPTPGTLDLTFTNESAATRSTPTTPTLTPSTSISFSHKLKPRRKSTNQKNNNNAAGGAVGGIGVGNKKTLFMSSSLNNLDKKTKSSSSSSSSKSVSMDSKKKEKLSSHLQSTSVPSSSAATPRALHRSAALMQIPPPSATTTVPVRDEIDNRNNWITPEKESNNNNDEKLKKNIEEHSNNNTDNMSIDNTTNPTPSTPSSTPIDPQHKSSSPSSPPTPPSPLSVASARRVAFIYDWDDTLLCSSYLRHFGYSLHSEILNPEIKKSLLTLDKTVENLLLLSSQITNSLYIITNSETGWVERSAMKFLPRTYSLITKLDIPIISARDQYIKAIPDAAALYQQSVHQAVTTPNIQTANACMQQPLAWKEMAFKKALCEWMGIEEGEILDNNNSIMDIINNKSIDNTTTTTNQPNYHIVCMGDTVERTAILNSLTNITGLPTPPCSFSITPSSPNASNASDTAESQPAYGPSVDEAFTICKSLSDKGVSLKSVKFPERPHVTQLEKQLTLIGTVVNYLASHHQPLDLYLSLAVMNNNNNHNANTATPATPESSHNNKRLSDNVAPMKTGHKNASINDNDTMDANPISV